MTYIPMPVVTEGGEQKVKIADIVSRGLLEQVLFQLRIMNVHLQEMTGEDVKESDVGGEGS